MSEFGGFGAFSVSGTESGRSGSLKTKVMRRVGSLRSSGTTSGPSSAERTTSRLRSLANLRNLSILVSFCTVVLTSAALLTVFYWYLRWREIDVAQMHSEYVSSTLTRRIPIIDTEMADIAHAIQFGTSFESRRVLPTDVNDATWFRYWHKVSLQFRNPQTTSPVLSTVTFAFADHSLVFCNLNSLTNLFCGSASPISFINYTNSYNNNTINFSNSSSSDVIGNTSSSTSGSNVTLLRYSMVNMAAKYSVISTYSTDGLAFRLWSQKVNTTPWSKDWGYFSADSYPRRPSLSLIFPFYNSSGYYLGAGKLGMNFDVLSTYLKEIQPTSHSSLILLNEHGQLLASGLDQDKYPTFAILPMRYLSLEERIRKSCTEADLMYNDNETMMLCLYSVADFGYKPLLELVDKYQHPIDLENNYIAPEDCNTPKLERRKLNGAFYWVTSVVFAPPIRFRWQVLLFMPEDDIDNGASVMAMYTAFLGLGGALLITIISAVVTGRLIKPLHVVAKEMQSGSYLNEQQPAVSNGHSKKDGVEGAVEGESLKEARDAPMNSERKLSMVIDIARIQSSYWEMVDELRALRGYIPEHICNEIVKSKVITGHQSASDGDKQPKSPPFSIAGGRNHIDSTNNNNNNNNNTTESPHQGGLTNSSESRDSPVRVRPRTTATALFRISNQSSAEPLPSLLSGLDLEGSLVEPSEAAMRLVRPTQTFATQPPVFFADNALVDRDISVAVVNIVGFHQYALVTHGADVTKHFEAFVSYLHATAVKCGGVLDTFSGDKFWVSFNATTKCDASAVAAACFGVEVAATVNCEAALAVDALNDEYTRRLNNEHIPKRFKARFRSALKGVTIGAATGRAFVGPLGTSTIRRHTILSNAVTEAAALERQSCHYPGSNFMVGGDMIPAIEGYMQYMLIDACCLPGSNGLRRRIASVRAPMCAPGSNQAHLRGLSEPLMVEALSATVNPYASANQFFNAFLEGRKEECVAMIRKVDDEISESASAEERNTTHITSSTIAQSPHSDPPPPQPQVLEVVKYSQPQRKTLVVLMQFVWSYVGGKGAIDGRRYESPLGALYKRYT